MYNPVDVSDPMLTTFDANKSVLNNSARTYFGSGQNLMLNSMMQTLHTLKEFTTLREKLHDFASKKIGDVVRAVADELLKAKEIVSDRVVKVSPSRHVPAPISCTCWYSCSSPATVVFLQGRTFSMEIQALQRCSICDMEKEIGVFCKVASCTR